MATKFIVTFLMLFTFKLHAELIEKNFVSEGHVYHVDEMSNFQYPFLTLTENNLLLVVHSSVYWDKDKRTWPATEKLVTLFDEKKFSYRYLAAIDERSNISDQELKLAGKYFPPGVTFSDLFPFQGDSHRIIFKGKNAVIAGGNFTICACEAVRSLIALSVTPNNEKLNIFYPMDAIYEGQKGQFKLLSEVVLELNDNQKFLAYLDDQYFNADTLPCKDPSLISFDRKFNYSIFLNGKEIGKRGNGKTAINLYFDPTEKILQKFQGEL